MEGRVSALVTGNRNTMTLILNIYDCLKSHRRIRVCILVFVTLLMAVLVSRLSFKEDISDFLPFDSNERENMEVFQNISGASEIVVLFDNPGDPQTVIRSIECFHDALDSVDISGWTGDAVWMIDTEKTDSVCIFINDHIPYFLTAADYARIDSLLSDDGYVSKALEKDIEMLMLPSGGFVQDNLTKDPLGLFSPVYDRLQNMHGDYGFELVDGYIFTPDMSRAIVTIRSPFGNRETGKNGQLLDLISDALNIAEYKCPDVAIHMTGGPVIAVENASQIRKDSLLAFIMASVLILLIMFYAFRSVTNIILTGVTVLWGFLFALAGMSLIREDVSLIVLGISSIIIGIAFNYPLHLINHLSHQPDIRLAMKDIASPLLIGNVTTVGAFVALIPLESVALRDLGIFASLMLLGTILFVLIFLPHYVKLDNSRRKPTALDRLARVRLDSSKPLVGIVVVLTIVFAFFAFQVEFDSDISNINYMTPEQRQDMRYFHSIADSPSQDNTQTVYVCTMADVECTVDSLVRGGKVLSFSHVSDFVPSVTVQRSRIEIWKSFVKKYGPLLYDTLDSVASEYGFADNAFADFREIISKDYDTLSFQSFAPIISTILRENIFMLSGKPVVVEKMTVPDTYVREVESRVRGSFDIKSINAALASRMTGDFNYIGWVCSAIVFLFLWYSFRSIRLTILAFMPMAVSWVWILGIMGMTSIQFNIVNIILATFIFGQGDDYTIFMVEGCKYEHTTGKPVLASYKSSIILSALIMFAGIGVLVFASHPAMYSLGLVTVVGMSCVVLTAFVVTPALYRLLFKR